MSGGHFDYKQFSIEDIINDIEVYLDGREIDIENINPEDYYLDEDDIEYIKKHGHTKGNQYNFSSETIAEMRKGVRYLKKALVYAIRIDWLLSGDDGEETFHKRLKSDLAKLRDK